MQWNITGNIPEDKEGRLFLAAFVKKY